ncbi:MAG: alpha-L-rhamnosidase [Spirochaetaceae bacterium]|nr:MAG: alpha-L-rhamnosidase [Spirochaetaceae bacterium]
MNHTIEPNGLLCDLLSRPERTLITNPKPRFSWIVNDTRPNAYQVAYRILVASKLELLAREEGDFWDSGVPEPATVWRSEPRSVDVEYGGKPLHSNSTYHWKVRTWHGVHDESPWSEPQTFHTGELSSTHQTPSVPLAVTTEMPVRFVRLSGDRVFVDFGRAVFGTVELTIEADRESTVEIHLGEVAAGASQIDRAPGGSRRYRMIRVETRAGRDTYRVEIPADPRNTGPIAILMPADLFEVYPFRYCEIVGAPKVFARADIRRLTVHHPFDDAAASFTSSSRVLNDVWEFCRYSMKATSFCGMYVDGDRERIPYEADAYINQLGHYACDRDFTMARRTHEHLITTPTWPTEWHLYSVLVAYNDLMYSGNTTSAVAFYDDLVAKTFSALARVDGLITTDNLTDEIRAAVHFTGKSGVQFPSGIRDIVDWPQVERDGYDMRPVNSVVNALHYRALRAMHEIALAVGNDDDAASFAQRAARVRDAFRTQLLDPDTGLVLDGVGSSHSALHANMFALASGLVPDEYRERVVEFIVSKGTACSVYASQMLLEALYAAGAGDAALALLTATGERSWAHMVYDVGTTIALEAWDDRFKPNQDWNHAWGAAPAAMIARGLMGITPLAPGFEKIRIVPQPGALAWADITVPTIRGPVRVAFNNDGASREGERGFHVELELPGNTTTVVGVPRGPGRSAALIVDGRRVFAREERGTLYVDGIGSGRHSITRC